MRNIQLTIVYCVIIIGVSFVQSKVCMAQEKGGVIKTNVPNYFLLGGANIALEKALSLSKSYLIDIGFGDYYYRDFGRERNKFYQMTLQFRKYYHPYKSLKGFFTGLYLRYRIKDVKQDYTSFMFINLQESKDFVAHSLNAGGVIGYQNYVFIKISIELNLGAGLGVNIFSTGKTHPSIVRADGIATLSAGYRF